MMEKIIGAFTFRKGVYAGVAKDPEFTTDAWLIVIVVNFVAQLGASAVQLSMGEGFFGYAVSVIVQTIVAVLGFAATAWLIAWLGGAMFKSTATASELVRAMGLANVWRIIGVLGILSAITPVLGCLTAPISLVAGIAGLVAYFFSIREATNMEWVGVIVTVIVALIVYLILAGIAGAILGIFGLGAAALLN